MWVFPVSKVQLLAWECSSLFPSSPTRCSLMLELQTPQRRRVLNSLHAFFSFFLLFYSPPPLLIPPRKIGCARYDRRELSRGIMFVRPFPVINSCSLQLRAIKRQREQGKQNEATFHEESHIPHPRQHSGSDSSSPFSFCFSPPTSCPFCTVRRSVSS